MFIFGVVGAGLCNHAADAAGPAQCFANPAAVFAAHPNATHASYSLRVKRSERCWYADAFNAEAKAKTKPVPRPVATAARTSTPRAAITAPVTRTAAVAPAPQPRAAVITPSPQLRTAAVAPAPRPYTTAVAPASPRVIMPFPSGIPPSIQIAVNAKALSRLLLADETPADFESRFSASGYKVRK
jgi:hypothetical protein